VSPTFLAKVGLGSVKGNMGCVRPFVRRRRAVCPFVFFRSHTRPDYCLVVSVSVVECVLAGPMSASVSYGVLDVGGFVRGCFSGRVGMLDGVARFCDDWYFWFLGFPEGLTGRGGGPSFVSQICGFVVGVDAGRGYAGGGGGSGVQVATGVVFVCCPGGKSACLRFCGRGFRRCVGWGC